MASLTQWTYESEQTPGDSEGQEFWWPTVHGVVESQTGLSNNKNQNTMVKIKDQKEMTTEV